jgi:hypothetical protein
MGILSKILGKQKKVEKVKKFEPKPQPKAVQVNKIEESRTTLRYDEQVITLEAFREGIRQRATIKAFRGGRFIPLRDLGKDLLIFDTEQNGYVPLQDSINPQHEDVKRFVFGGQ